MKKGDKIKCIKFDNGLCVGAVYTVESVGEGLGGPTVHLEGKVSPYYQSYFEPEDSLFQLKEDIELAKKAIGNVVNHECYYYPIKGYDIILDEESAKKASLSCLAFFRKNGYCVALTTSRDGHVPAGACTLINPSINFQLNEKYSAKIFRDKVEVGCQTFPASVIEELYNKMKSLQK